MRLLFSSSNLRRGACLASLHKWMRGEPGSPPKPFLRTGIVFHDAADRYNKWLLQVRRATDLEEAPRFVNEAIAAAPDLSGEQDMDIRGVYRRHVGSWSIDPETALGAERAIVLDRDLNVIPWDPALEYDGDRAALRAAMERTPTRPRTFGISLPRVSRLPPVLSFSSWSTSTRPRSRMAARSPSAL